VKILVSGWFSFEAMGATAGDLIARDRVTGWLEEQGLAYDVAVAPPFALGIDWRTTDPKAYSHVIFVCGPFGQGEPVVGFLKHFEGCRLIGLNLSMLEPVEKWNPFDLLIERDSSRTSNPDLTFLGGRKAVPVVGVLLVHPQAEYGKKARHPLANQAIQRLISSREMACVTIDTRLDTNTTGLRTPAEIEALIARMDLVLTTRLHGLVLAIKNGVPALAVDPIAGGAKILRQAQTIGWPAVFTVDQLEDQVLYRAWDYCLSNEARAKAQECSSRARTLLGSVYGSLFEALKRSDESTKV